jgi:plastocyanin
MKPAMDEHSNRGNMKRLDVVNGILVVLSILLFPAVSLANNAVPGAGMPMVEISFESTAPYYLPQVAIASAGVPVRWSNSTPSPHSIQHDGCLTDESCAFSSIAVLPDDSFVIAPLPPGRYYYHCELHPIMRGTLIVVESQTRPEENISVVESGR